MTRTGYEIGISIFINADGSLGLFENGLRQNVLFLYHLFRAAPGCTRVYLVNGGDGELRESPEPFGVDPAHVVRLETISSRLDVLIVMGAALDPAQVRDLRERGCRIIGYKGGNGAVISMEAVVAKGAREDGERYFDADLYDEIWLTPQHWRTFSGWCQTMYRCPVRPIPHIWSPLVLQASVGEGFGYRPGAARWRIGILDPNITVMKTSHLPMLACEVAYRRKPEALRAVYVTNGIAHREDPHFASFAQSLSVVQAGIMTVEPRFVGSHFLKDHCEAVVTHQWENGLNYLYWEALFGGYPLIHNSSFLEGVGYFYPDFDAEAGGAALLGAWERHDADLPAYRDRAQTFIAALDPTTSANLRAHEAGVTGAPIPSARPPEPFSGF